MAENIKWLKENYLNSKVIVSAHNYHIAKLNSDRMGYCINEAYADDFVNFGFAFMKVLILQVLMGRSVPIIQKKQVPEH
ncbi:erythromycin esterase family protein [Chryseobacterium sp. 1B4]